jgi:ATP/ADP translocase/HEAT repeat protein
MKNRLLQLLNIRPDEAWLVTNLFWLQFFQGFGIAVFNTVSTTIFIEHFEGNELAEELPRVYMYSAVLLLITGYVYNKFEHALSIKKLVLGVIGFLALSVLTFRLQFFISSPTWLIILLYSWYNVIYLLSNLEFWGVAALMFDIRQSKRLFGMIGAGDIPAKLAGYSVVPILIALTSPENLLLLSVLSFACSLVFYFKLNRAGKLDLHVKHEHGHTQQHTNTERYYSSEKITGLIKSFFSNRMISYVAGLSFIVVSCVTIITFAFYSQVKHEMHSDEQLARFISIFFVAGGATALVVRLVLTGRLANILGIKGSLLISPLVLLVFLLGTIFLPFFIAHDHLYMYVFGMMMILTQVLKTSLQDPVFLSVMQPLSSHMRLKGHASVKGVMDPFALGFSGLVLMGLYAWRERVDLPLLTYILCGLVLVWIVMIFFVDREYVKTLVTALHKRYSVGSEIDLSSEQTREVLESKIAGGERGEAIYILNLLERNYSSDYEGLVIKALDNPKQEVKTEAIKLAERKKIIAALPKIEELIETRIDNTLLPEAVKAKCMLQPDEIEQLNVFVEDTDYRLMKAAVTGLMISGGISAVVSAGQKLLQLIASPVAEERKIAAEIIGELAVHTFYKPLLQLLKDNDNTVVEAAITAAGHVKNEKLAQPLMELFLNKKHEKIVLQAFYDAGDAFLPEVHRVLTHKRLSHQQQSRLISLCGRIGSEKAVKILDELVWKLMSVHSDTFYALHMCQYRAEPEKREQYIELMQHYITTSIRILFMINEAQRDSRNKILADALQLELNSMRDSMLLLFSFVYDREKMIKAKSGFLLNKKDSIANALEVIEIEVPKDISLKFAKIFEPGSVADKCQILKPEFRETITYPAMIDAILTDKLHHYNRWTKAAALYTVQFYTGTERSRWAEKAARENDILLKEMADKITA